MPGHVHTLGILKNSRSRNDRNQRGGIEDDDCLLGDNEELSYNPTGDPLLDAKMLQVVIRFSTRLKRNSTKTLSTFAGARGVGAEEENL